MKNKVSTIFSFICLLGMVILSSNKCAYQVDDAGKAFKVDT